MIKIKETMAIGRRKTAVAKVKITAGLGKIKINGQEIANRESLQRTIRRYQSGQKLVFAIQRASRPATVTA